MGIEKAIFNRSELLLGPAIMQQLARTRVIIFGVGGVGSWAAESLVRSGVGHLTLVDSDRICITNVNRQLMATTSTVGQVKVEALRQRLIDIAPAADVQAVQAIYSDETAHRFELNDYDYVLDAIDSLKDKASLILRATQSHATLFASMGAALKIDPTRIRVAEFWKVSGDPLAAALRRRFRRDHTFPRRKFSCVYSDEVLRNAGANTSCGTSHCLCPKATTGPGDPALLSHEWCSAKAQINGSLAHITAIFGMTLGGLVLNDVYRRHAHRSETHPNFVTKSEK